MARRPVRRPPNRVVVTFGTCQTPPRWRAPAQSNKRPASVRAALLRKDQAGGRHHRVGSRASCRGPPRSRERRVRWCGRSPRASCHRHRGPGSGPSSTSSARAWSPVTLTGRMSAVVAMFNADRGDHGADAHAQDRVNARPEQPSTARSAARPSGGHMPDRRLIAHADPRSSRAKSRCMMILHHSHDRGCLDHTEASDPVHLGSFLQPVVDAREYERVPALSSREYIRPGWPTSPCAPWSRWTDPRSTH